MPSTMIVGVHGLTDETLRLHETHRALIRCGSRHTRSSSSHDAFRNAMERTLQQGAPLHFEGSMYRADRTLRRIELYGNLQPGSGDKRLEQSLLQAEKIAATGRMAATIAHQINNPLAAVMNLLFLLRPKIVDEEGIHFLATAESELGRVSHIAKQTLGYYREHASPSHASH